jgi:hypothetical protein
MAIKNSVVSKNEHLFSCSPTTGKTKLDDSQRTHVNFDENSTSNSTSMTSFSNSVGGKKSRERSNTKYLAQFWELNRMNINTMVPDEKMALQSLAGSNDDQLTGQSPPSQLMLTDTQDDYRASIIKDQMQSHNGGYQKNGENKTITSGVQTFMIENNVVKRKLPFYADSDLFIGFLWSWNFMLGKRWRNQYTGDELFQDSALADFRAFCSNKELRLQTFFNKLN